MTLKECAISYVRDLKWSIFPCAPKTKKPLVKWGPYQSRLPSIEEVEYWWNKWPEANIGVITGKISGILCIDIDSQKSQDFYLVEYGEIHNTVRQTTGRPGGLHLIFNYPLDGKPYRNVGDVSREGQGPAESIEIHARADGGFFVAAPSIHPNGTQYAWIVDPIESPDDIMDLPEEVKGLWGYIKKETPGRTLKNRKTKEEKDRLDIQRYLIGADEPEYPGAGEGGRVIGRDSACVRLAGHYLRLFQNDSEEVRSVLYLWGTRCRPEFPEKEVDKCIDSILSKQGREEAKEKIGAFIQKIERLIYPDGTFKYHVYVDGCLSHITLTTAELFEQRQFIYSLYDQTGQMRMAMKKKDWLEMMNKVSRESIVDIHIGEDQTIIGTIRDILIQELPRMSDKMELIKSQFVKIDEKVIFKLSTVLDHLRGGGDKTIRINQLGKYLERMGAYSDRPRVDGTDKTRISVWFIRISDIEK